MTVDTASSAIPVLSLCTHTSLAYPSVARCNGMLNNEKFTSKAPQSKIDEEKAKLVKYTQMLEQVQERLGQLK